jgi:hypothetical protein
MSLQRFPQHLCLQARPKQTILGHEELCGPTKWGRMGAQKRYPKHCSSLEYGPACLPRKLNSAALCLLILLGRARQVRNHGHRTLGIAVHRPCLFQRHHHRCNLDRFSCAPRGNAKSFGFSPTQKRKPRAAPLAGVIDGGAPRLAGISGDAAYGARPDGVGFGLSARSPSNHSCVAASLFQDIAMRR